VANVNSQTVGLVTNIVKSPADAIALVKGYDAEKPLSTYVGAAGLIISFAEMITTNKEIANALKIAGVIGSVTSLGINAKDVFTQVKETGKIQDSTIFATVADITAIVTGIVGFTVSSSMVVPLGLVAATTLAVVGAFEEGTDISDGTIEAFNEIQKVAEVSGDFINKFLNELGRDINQFTKDLFDVNDTLQYQYEDYLENTTIPSDALDYSQWLIDNNTVIDITDEQRNFISILQQLEINNITIGEQTYTIQPGDTISELAVTYNTSVEKILEANPWLQEENRVSDDLSYVLIKAGEEIKLPEGIDVTSNTLVGGTGGDTLVDKNGGNDTLIGNEGDDYLDGGSGSDVLKGGVGDDTLIGGEGDDVLIGNEGADQMQGGDGFDTYVASSGDTIVDSDGKGKVLFDNIDLSGRKKKKAGTSFYEDDDYIYTKSGSTLTVTSKKDSSNTLTINGWNNYDLGINLSENDDVEVSISDASALEAAESMTFMVSLSRVLEDGETITVSADGNTLTFNTGDQVKTFKHKWSDDDIPESNVTFTITPTISDHHLPEGAKVIVTNSGTGTIIDDDDDKRYDPLALDTNKDGFIATSSLEDSTTYFDITGDGLRERVGWIKDEDALLVYDKNENKQIDGINEVFGNLSESGFEELKRLVDTNHDNQIDRRDELFSRLQVWNDTNQDAKAQENELRTLQEAGIKSIDLNIVETSIEIEGNLLTEASKYTDAEGNRELVADIQLATDVKDTKVEIEDIPNFTIDESTRELPQIKGSGLVYDSFILYNIDEEFKAVAKAMSSDIRLTATQFDSFLEHYSGYTKYVNELAQRYSVENFTMHQPDKKTWIMERFDAQNVESLAIENYYKSNLIHSTIPSETFIESTNIEAKYRFLKNSLESTFAIQSVFKEQFVDTTYDLGTKEFTINNVEAFTSKISDFLNDDTNSIDEKLYLVKVMQMQHSKLDFNIDEIVQAIDNNIVKELARYLFIGNEVTLFENSEGYHNGGLLIATEGDDIITTSDADSKMYLSKGDDKLISGRGHDSFYFNRGDGVDTIYDKGGMDRLVFGKDITRESVEIRLERNTDLTIALKEIDKTFEELTDKVIIVDWMKSSNRIDVVEFSDGSKLKFQDVFDQFIATDDAEVVQLSSGNDALDTHGGSDVIKAIGGNDTLIGAKGKDRLEGGYGNDTYIFNRGDGEDSIYEEGGHDTLQFGIGITQDDLALKYIANDLVIALKEEGVVFDALKDVITLKNYKSGNSIDAIYLEGYKIVDIEKLFDTPTKENDDIELGNLDETIDLLAGDDRVVSLGGNDTLIGNVGNDVLEGGLGDDTYIFNRGDGKDTIYDDYSYGFQDSRKENAGNDTLQFGEGITLEDIFTKYSGTDLLIGIKEGDTPIEQLNDVITIKNYTNENNRIENLLLYDGTTISNDEILYGTLNTDVINLENANEDITIQGLDGRDFIHTGAGNDNLEGGGDSDDLFAGEGNDTLIGGGGNDFLVGGAGDDTYIYNLGDGDDQILDDNRPGYYVRPGGFIVPSQTMYMQNISGVIAADGGNDTLKFGNGITRDNISFRVSENDLIISIIDTNEQILITKYFNKNNTIENLLLEDGTFVEVPLSIDSFDEDGANGFIFKGGQVTIFKSSKIDSIKFSTITSSEDLEARYTEGDLVIGIKEEGVSFDDLSNKIVVQGNTVENIELNDGTTISLIDILQEPTEGDDVIDYSFRDDNVIVEGLDGNDDITTGSGNDIISGGAGEDSLKGGAGDDTIEGGADNDTLSGGSGNDRYIFDRGEGRDTIIDTSGEDSIVFSQGITIEDLEARYTDGDLVIGIKEEGVSFDDLSNKIVVRGNTIKNIELNDGTTISLIDILQEATEGDDVIDYSFRDDNVIVEGLDGKDDITTGSGNDIISGGTGEDSLKGGAGDDTIEGGADNDTLSGGSGNDRYIFDRGEGRDTIIDTSGEDSIVFSQGITIEDLEARYTDGDLVIGIKEEGVSFDDLSNKIVVRGNTIKNIELNDGTTISLIDILQYPATEGNDRLYYENIDDNLTIEGLGGDDEIIAGRGNDTIIGGHGNDILYGYFGDDTYIFNRADGTDIIISSSGNNTLIFGEGITLNELTARRVNTEDVEDGLAIAIKEDGVDFENLSDKIITNPYYLNAILLHDGTEVDIEVLLTKSTQDNDLIDYSKSEENLTIDALAGDDTVSTGSGDDLLLGSDGDDVLYANAGSDRLQGGRGDDKLYGGLGDDFYIFSRGDGSDTVYDSKGADTLTFGNGIVQNDLLFKQEGYQLIIALKEEGKSYDELSDKIVITDWFRVQNNIEKIQFSDGSTMGTSTIASMFIENSPDTLLSHHGALMLGGQGDDTYVYKKDDFTVIIDDRFYNKEIAIDAGDDTLQFADINKEQITLGTKGDDLIIKIDAGHDTYTELKDYVVIRDWQNADKGIERIVFGNGEVLLVDKSVDYTELEFDENWITGRYYIYGSEANSIEGSNSSEVIESGAGDDTVYANDGADYITGGLGNDTLVGGAGNDTFVFARGDGIDTISDGAGVDSVKFAYGITSDELLMEQVGYDLVIGIKDADKTLEELSDKLILKNWFDTASISNRIELMITQDGGTVSIADFLIRPTQGSDNLKYGDENNNIDALAGDDTIHVGGGNDVLVGNTGNDRLYGGSGDDTLSGDEGVDILYGTEGNDTYLFGRGDSQDIVVEDGFINWGQTGTDTLKFKEGISPDDLIILQSGDDLVVGLKEDGKSFEELRDSVTLKKWALYDDENSRDYSRAYYTVERFSFSDGSSWNMADIIAHIGSDKSETIQGYNDDDTLEAKKGDDTLLGHLGDDTYVFNRGDGKDIIYDYGRKGDNYSFYDGGNDTLRFGEGIAEDDLIVGKDNNDVIIYIKEDNKPVGELGDKITIKDWFLTNNRVENMILADGTKIDFAKYLSVEPTENSDVLVYGYEDDIVDALGGDDTVIALGGNNIIDGNSGNDNIKTEDGVDTLIGGEGDDILDAGANDDMLEGGAGNDIYIYNLGDGRDKISDLAHDGEFNSIHFGESISSESLQFIRRDNELTIVINESDTITVENWFSELGYRVDELKFSDGTSLNSDDVENRVSYYGDENDNTMIGSDNSSHIYGLEGDDVITGRKGDDKLLGGTGSDTYIYNLGDGHDSVFDYEQGSDELNTFIFGEGISYMQMQQIREGDDLLLVIDEQNSVRIQEWYIHKNFTKFLFSDSSSVIYGNELDNYIRSGEGSDRIYGEDGDDTYLFFKGSGRDVISDSSGIDTIEFSEDITINDLFVKKDGDTLIIALYEEGKDFSTFSDVISILENSIEKIKFADNSGLDVSDIILEMAIENDAQELDAIATIYTGTLNEDSSDTAHSFKFLDGSILVDVSDVTDITIIILDAQTGAFEVEGNFDALAEGEKATVSFEYEVNYDSENLELVSGRKRTTLTVVGTNDMPEVTGQFTADVEDIAVSGKVTVFDLDNAESEVQPQSQIDGTYGTFNIDKDGNWSYGNIKNILAEGESATETFSVVSKDGTVTKDIILTLYGIGNYAPIIVPVVVEQQIGDDGINSQFISDIAVLSDGNYVVTWTVYNPDTFATGISLQKFNPQGEKIGDEIEVVSSTNLSIAVIPRIKTLNNGGYVLVWYFEDTNGAGYNLQQFTSVGTKVGIEQIVNINSTYYIFPIPTIKSLEKGGYVFLWRDRLDDTSEHQLFVQQFDANFQKIGAVQQVSNHVGNFVATSYISLDRNIESLTDGGYVVVWKYYDRDTIGSTIYLQRFNSSGEKVGEEQGVITFVEGHHYELPDITSLDNGGYVITWNSPEQQGFYDDIYLQQFGSDGKKIGIEQVVNTTRRGSQELSAIRTLNDGSYVVAWFSAIETSLSVSNIFIQRFDISGEKVGIEQKVNTFPINYNSGISITGIKIISLNSSGYVVIWSNTREDSSGIDINLQQFNSLSEKIGAEQLVTTQGKENLFLSVTTFNDGGYALTWTKGGLENIGGEVFVQRYDSNGQRIGEAQGPVVEFDLVVNEATNGTLFYVQDSDGDALHYSGVAQNGEFIINERGQWSYSPNSDFVGTDEVNITIDDGKGGVLVHTLTFNVGVSEPVIASPIVLDLNNNELTSVSLENSNAYFDYDGDGNREHTAWMESGDAQLVVDINQDGIINDGSEIFGEYTRLADGTLAKDGYEALAQYDTNNDRVINAEDKNFGDLLLWRDANQNGKSEEGELTNIQLSSVTAINLDIKDGITYQQSMENGNIILNETNYKGLDGDGLVRDIGFVYDAQDTITNNDTLITQFGSELSGADGDDTYIYSVKDGIVTIDDKGDGVDTLKLLGDITKEHLVVKWDRSNNGLIIGIKSDIEDTTALVDLKNKIIIKNWFEQSGLIENITFSDETTLDREAIYQILLEEREDGELTAKVLDADGELSGGERSDILYGNRNDEKLQGLAGDDFLKGQEGNDLLIGGEGNDTLEGGEGDDTLQGDSGDDFYIYNRGDGKDLIVESSGFDTLTLGEGISIDDVLIVEDGYDVLVGLKEDNKEIYELSDVIRIKHQLVEGIEVEHLEFYDGSVITLPKSNRYPTIQQSDPITLQDIREITGVVEAEDSDGDVLTYSISSDALHGTLTIDENGVWDYKVDALYLGEDGAEITVDDGHGGVVSTTLSFEAKITPPQVVDYELSMKEDESFSQILEVGNPSNSNLSYSVENNPTNGTVTIDEENALITYSPSENYNGDDSLAITVKNEYGHSATSHFVYQIEAVNDIPIVEENEVVTLVNARETSGKIDAKDVDHDILSYKVEKQPDNGTLSVDSNGAWNYRAELSFNGEDSAIISVDDGNGGVVNSTLMFSVEGYIYHEGDLVIEDSSGDEIVLSGIDKEDLSFTRELNDLQLSVIDRGKITLKDYFTNVESGVDRIIANDGVINLDKEKITTVSLKKWYGYTKGEEDLNNLLIGSRKTDWMQGANKNDVLFGGSKYDYLEGFAGDDTLIGGDKGDVLKGGDGEDNLYGDSGNDWIYGDKGDDTLIGAEGNDHLYGGEGDDFLSSGIGNDTLRGEEGNDTLVANGGTNTLMGGAGDDTYLVHKGNKKVSIYDNDFRGRKSVDAGSDRLLFGEGIYKENIRFVKNRYGNLDIHYADREKVTIHGQNSEDRAIERVELNDGSYLTSDEIELLIQNLTAYAKDNGISMRNDRHVREDEVMMQMINSAWNTPDGLK